jgi:3-hydroxyacyl-CoA dehydrogenase/enoyl-CoA hydratase/3-hydroxybutyryl-CoA epimerase
MPLVEIIRGATTSDKTIAVVAALASKLGKYPVVVKDVPGFLVNRILSPYLNEAAYLIEDGFSILDIDRVAARFGMPMGPVRLLDEVGLDIVVHVSEVMIKGYGARMATPPFADMLVKAGRKGKKNGKGFYDFSEDGRTATPFAGLRDLLALKKPARSGDDQVIFDRLFMALINESIRCLDDGVAGTPGPDAAQQIDLATVMGMGFPPFRGGLLHFADSLGADKVLATLQKLEKEYGSRFAPAPGIIARAKRSRKLSDRS